jgi:two-component sensor histidine kinase
MTLDFRTLLIHSSAIMLVLSFAPFFFPLRELRQRVYLRLWVMAFPLVFLGTILVAMKGLLPDAVTMIFGHLLLKSGGVATLAGIVAFKGSRLPRWLAIGIVSTYVIPFMVSPLLAQNLVARSLYASSHSLVLYSITAVILLRRRDMRLGRMELCSALFLVIMSVLNALRLVIIVRLGYAVESGTGPLWDALITILYSVTFMGLGFALFTLHSARLATELREALDAKQLLMREMSHRLKNNLALVNSLLGMVPDFSVREGSAEEWVGGIRNRIACIAEAHDLLHASEDIEALRLDHYLARLVNSLPVPPNVTVTTDFHALEVPSSLAIPLGLVANELATNSLRHAFTGRGEGRIAMSLVHEAGRGLLIVSDNGIGTSWPPEHESFGSLIISALVAQMDGTLDYRSVAGSTWRISFPLGQDPGSQSSLLQTA